MSDLHLWMQAWSDQGEQVLARVESIDKFDNNVIALDCRAEEFRSIEGIALSTPTQKDIKRATEKSAANERTEGI